MGTYSVAACVLLAIGIALGQGKFVIFDFKIISTRTGPLPIQKFSVCKVTRLSTEYNCNNSNRTFDATDCLESCASFIIDLYLREFNTSLLGTWNVIGISYGDICNITSLEITERFPTSNTTVRPTTVTWLSRNSSHYPGFGFPTYSTTVRPTTVTRLSRNSSHYPGFRFPTYSTTVRPTTVTWLSRNSSHYPGFDKITRRHPSTPATVTWLLGHNSSHKPDNEVKQEEADIPTSSGNNLNETTYFGWWTKFIDFYKKHWINNGTKPIIGIPFQPVSFNLQNSQNNVVIFN